MSTSFLYHAFKLDGIKYFSTQYEKKCITFFAEVTKKFAVCKKCKNTKTHFRGKKRRIFKLVPIGRKKCFLNLIIHRIYCPKCGCKFWVKLPFIKGKNRMTNSFIKFVLDLLSFSTIKDVSKFVGLNWNVIKRIHKTKLKNMYKKIMINDLKYIGIDEFSIRKGHNYITIFIDLNSGQIIHAVEGKSSEVITPFLLKLAKKSPNLKAIAMDMSKAYYSAVKKNLPNIDVVFDHFHINALVNKTLDEIRKEQQNNLNKNEAKILKGSRFLLLKNYENLPIKDQERLQALLKVNQPLYIGYTLKEQLRLLWSKKSIEEADNFFINWGLDALCTDIKPLKRLIKTLNNYKEGILNYFKHKITNAITEGTNNKIKTMKRQAYGYRDTEYFKLRLYNLHQTRYAFVG